MSGSESRSMSPRFTLLVDGEGIALEDEHAVVGVRVDEAVDRLDAFEVVVAPDDGPGGVDDRLRLGAAVEIRVGYGAVEDEQVLIEGEVTCVEPSFPEGGPARLRVRGFDLLHRLGRGRRTRTFQDLSDADVARQIAAELGLTAQVEDTGEARGHTAQRDCTDADFLRQLARRNGFVLRVRRRSLEMGLPRLDRPPSHTLTWGRDLIACEMRWNTHDQVGRVEVRGWDPRRKEAVVGVATAAGLDPMGGGRSGPDAADRAHGGETSLVLSDARATTQAEANRIAAAEMASRAARFGTAHGVAQGLPDLRSGTTVRLAGLGPFSGNWFVVATRHVVDGRNGYRTSFDLVRNAEG